MSKFAAFTKGLVGGIQFAQQRELYNRQIADLDRVERERQEMAAAADPDNPAYQSEAINVTGRREYVEPQQMTGNWLEHQGKGYDTRTEQVPLNREGGVDQARRYSGIASTLAKHGRLGESLQFQQAAETEPSRRLAMQASDVYGKFQLGDYEGVAGQLGRLYDSIPDGRLARARWDGSNFEIDLFDQETGNYLGKKMLSPDQVGGHLLNLRDPKLAFEWSKQMQDNAFKRAELRLKEQEIEQRNAPKWSLSGNGEHGWARVEEKSGQTDFIGGAGGFGSKRAADNLKLINSNILSMMNVESLEGLTDDQRPIALRASQLGGDLYQQNQALWGTEADSPQRFSALALSLAGVEAKGNSVEAARQAGFSVFQDQNGQPQYVYRKSAEDPTEYVRYRGVEYLYSRGTAIPAGGVPPVQAAENAPQLGTTTPKPAPPSGMQQKPARYYSMGPDGKLVPDDENGTYERSGTSHVQNRGRVVATHPDIRAIDAAIKDAMQRQLHKEVADLVRIRERRAQEIAKEKGFADGGKVGNKVNIVSPSGRRFVEEEGPDGPSEWMNDPRRRAAIGDVMEYASHDTRSPTRGQREIRDSKTMTGKALRLRTGAAQHDEYATGRKIKKWLKGKEYADGGKVGCKPKGKRPMKKGRGYADGGRMGRGSTYAPLPKKELRPLYIPNRGPKPAMGGRAAPSAPVPNKGPIDVRRPFRAVGEFLNRFKTDAPIGMKPVTTSAGQARDQFGRPVKALGQIKYMQNTPQMATPTPSGKPSRQETSQQPLNPYTKRVESEVQPWQPVSQGGSELEPWGGAGRAGVGVGLAQAAFGNVGDGHLDWGPGVGENVPAFPEDQALAIDVEDDMMRRSREEQDMYLAMKQKYGF